MRSEEEDEGEEYYPWFKRLPSVTGQGKPTKHLHTFTPYSRISMDVCLFVFLKDVVYSFTKNNTMMYQMNNFHQSFNKKKRRKLKNKHSSHSCILTTKLHHTSLLGDTGPVPVDSFVIKEYMC